MPDPFQLDPELEQSEVLSNLNLFPNHLIPFVHGLPYYSCLLKSIAILVKTFRDTNHYSITTSADSCFTIQLVVILHLRVFTARSCGHSGMFRESNSTTLVYTLPLARPLSIGVLPCLLTPLTSQTLSPGQLTLLIP